MRKDTPRSDFTRADESPGNGAGLDNFKKVSRARDFGIRI